MKKILAVILSILMLTVIFANDKSFNINKTWIDLQRRQRSYFQKRDLLNMDTQTIEILENSDIPAELETEVADLLYEIIKYDSLDAVENSLKAVKILGDKFQDKKHFFTISIDFANNHSENNPVIMAQIFNNMKALIKGHYEDNLITMQSIYESIRGTYIVGAKSGAKKYKTDVVIKFLKEYLNEFDRLYNESEIEKDTELEQIIIKIKADLDIYELL